MTAQKNFRIDSFVAGLAFKAPCVAVSLVNITLYGEQTVNGIALLVNDRCLVTGQTDPIENGIWDVQATGWQRSQDFDGNRDVTGGTRVGLAEVAGATGTIWRVVGDVRNISPGTDSILFETDSVLSAGNVMRYGAVNDSSLGVKGTDNTVAFQAAIDSGNPVVVPPGYFCIDGTLLIQSGGSTQGGKTFHMTSNTRLERFSAVVNDPIIQVVGDQNYVDGGGGILACRASGGFTEGVLLVGVNPTVTDNGDVTAVDTRFTSVKNFKLQGLTSNTGWDGSVGFYVNAAARKRGIWKTGGNDTDLYYNSFSGIRAQQFDYPVHFSSEASFNAVSDFSSNSYGHAAYSILGYGNQCTGMICETATAQDTTERFVVFMGAKNTGPETGTDASATSIIAITGVSAAASAVVTAVAHGLVTEDTVKIVDVVDNGPGGDLETAINNGHWQVTRLTDDTFSIPLDTSGLTNTYSSAGTMQDNFLPNTGARVNYFSGSAETSFDAGTKVIRVFSPALVVGNYDVADLYSTYDENIVTVLGSQPGGVGISGFTTLAGIGRNEVNTHGAKTIRGTPVQINSFNFKEQDDNSGDSFGTDSFRTYSGRVSSLAESFTYDLLSIDNVGTGSASVLIELSIQVKDSAGSDHMGGSIVFMCPVTADTARAAVEVSRNFVSYGNPVLEPILVPIVVEEAGTTANTGKFTLKLATQVITGTGNSFCTWVARIISSNEEGTNLDWTADVKLLSSSTSELIADVKWNTNLKVKLASSQDAAGDTLTDDPHLAGWDLEADTWYKVEGFIHVDSDTTAKFKWMFDFSSAAQVIAIMGDYPVLSSHGDPQITTTAITCNTATPDAHGTYSGIFKTHLTVGGDVAFQWAQNLTDAYATTVEEGSYMKITRLDSNLTSE